MDGRGGCCIARYAGGGAHDLSKMDQIMQRFRPIAPKPATGGVGSVSGVSAPDNNSVKSGRGKRKYLRDSSSSGSGSSGSSNNSTKRCSKKRKASSPAEDTVVTLPLLPETPERKDSPARVSLSDHLDLTITKQEQHRTPIWLNFDGGKMNNNSGLYDHRTLVMQQAVQIVGSWVTVECVTDTWMDGSGLGRTDEERVRNLERDTCPGFISDGMNRVTWTNRAYRNMVGGGEGVGEGKDEMMVLLAMKERLPVSYPAFTCRVRMQYTCASRKEKSSVTLPCDVWRMDGGCGGGCGGGGFAWRLDVKAALCLGR